MVAHVINHKFNKRIDDHSPGKASITILSDPPAMLSFPRNDSATKLAVSGLASETLSRTVVFAGLKTLRQSA